MKDAAVKHVATVTIFFFLFFSGFSHAEVVHPEDSNIVGAVVSDGDLDFACFNNDGAVAHFDECSNPGSAEFEGEVGIANGSWFGGLVGIYACEDAAADPVSSASCSYHLGFWRSCTPKEFILVQTVNSGHYWAVKANLFCTNIAAPEATGLVPCLQTDVFDPVNGCGQFKNQTAISAKGGYIQLEVQHDRLPPETHCSDSSHHGRLVVDDVNDLLYICTQSGWIAK